MEGGGSQQPIQEEGLANPTRQAELEGFSEAFSGALDEMMDMGIFDDSPMSPDPGSMGLFTKGYEELEPDELVVINERIFRNFQVNLAEPVRTYNAVAPDDARVPGPISVRVFRTHLEGTFVQQMTFADGESRLVIGPDQDL